MTQRSELRSKFADRHIGISPQHAEEMLAEIGYGSLEKLLDVAVPDSIKDYRAFDLPQALSESEATRELEKLINENQIVRTLIGTGYYDTITPAVIQRNILENPSWYTQYTPYQPEISQGRLEALLNYQTMVSDLTGLPIANASLLDEGTAAAEAMNMALNLRHKDTEPVLLVAKDCHPQTIAVVETRAKYLGIKVIKQDINSFEYTAKPFGVLMQYPATDGSIHDVRGIASRAKKHNALIICATDLMALSILESPGSLGADIAVGNSQRFGVPLGYGGPHAAFIATKEGFERKLPGRIVGVSVDDHGNKAYRLALATREQHIRRDKATSNICTAQVLLAIMASMYGVYHGPRGIKEIADRIHSLARIFATGLKNAGMKIRGNPFFDTVTVVQNNQATRLVEAALGAGFNIRLIDYDTVSVAFDELSTIDEVQRLLNAFGANGFVRDLKPGQDTAIPVHLQRRSKFMEHKIFNSHHSEVELTRYIKKLERRDLSLTQSMIPLGSCTMKLNAASELMPITWPKINKLHPFAPLEQAKGYQKLFNQLENYLAEITGFHSVSLQPNSGAQGEYAGLLAIRRMQEDQGQGHRDVCLIPTSAHGTNPASAALAGLKVVALKCGEDGDIDLQDLKAKAAEHAANLSAIMITYPSTHGVFEEGIGEICKVVHEHGGQVYMDGANLQAQIGLCRAGEFGPDVCHLNLHKTFCIPHGGGGPGVGPIAVQKHLTPYLPGHPLVALGGPKNLGTISAAPWGSPSILPISWMYIRMMGGDGLALATKIAILSANYCAQKLKPHYDIVYTGRGGLVAHECIINLKPIKKASGIDEADIAKRLMDFGFHAPTVSWPVPASMMIEPTESEPKAELDRFIEAMIQIKKEIDKVINGEWPKDQNPLKMAPHTAPFLMNNSWELPYTREEAAYPLAWVKENKFWPFVGRIDSAHGDRHFVCSCPPMEDYQ